MSSFVSVRPLDSSNEGLIQYLLRCFVKQAGTEWVKRGGEGRSGKGRKKPKDKINASNEISDGFVCLFVGRSVVFVGRPFCSERKTSKKKRREKVHGTQDRKERE